VIQRIQSIFLLVASGALFGLLGVPYVQTEAGDPSRTVAQLSDGVLNPFDNIGLLGLTLLGGFVALVSIFMYKNRSLQAKLVAGGIMVGIFLLVLSVFVAKMTLDAVPEGGVTRLGPGWAMPVIAIVNFWLAMRQIRKDEQLVRSMDRLR
jgi:peptidoglycan/LPS O-acetylase OafA/YrhL